MRRPTLRSRTATSDYQGGGGRIRSSVTELASETFNFNRIESEPSWTDFVGAKLSGRNVFVHGISVDPEDIRLLRPWKEIGFSAIPEAVRIISVAQMRKRGTLGKPFTSSVFADFA